MVSAGGRNFEWHTWRVCVNVLFVFRLCKNVVDKKPCKNLASPGARRATIDIQVGVIELPDMR